MRETSADRIEAVLDEARDLLAAVQDLRNEVPGEDQGVRLCIVRSDMRSVVVMLESALQAEIGCGGRLSGML